MRSDFPDGTRYEFGLYGGGNGVRFIAGGNSISCSGRSFAAAVTTQETMNLLRWYGNSNNVQRVQVVS